MNPCPFCEKSLASVRGLLGAYRVQCMELDGGCGATGPLALNPEEATKLWNRRGPHRCIRCKDPVNPEEDPMPFCKPCEREIVSENADYS